MITDDGLLVRTLVSDPIAGATDCGSLHEGGILGGFGGAGAAYKDVYQFLYAWFPTWDHSSMGSVAEG